MKNADATGNAVKVVNAMWALVVGTLMLNWIRTDLYPHLIDDGSLAGDYGVLLGAFAIAVVMAAPSVFKSRAVDFMEAVKAWREK